MAQSHPQDEFVIEEGIRDDSLLRMLLQAPSFGGKTVGALILASGMVAALRRRGMLPNHLSRYIGLIDSERKSSKKASGRFNIEPFDILPIEPPYTPVRYMAAIGKLQRVGYPIIIVDQISHEWSGEGGVLSMVSDARKNAQNDFAAWNGPSQQHEEFMDCIQNSTAHMICTARSKTAWELVEKTNSQGRKVKAPERIGMQAKQREGTEFEFDLVLDLRPGSNEVRCIKDRMGFFNGVDTYAPLTSDIGGKFVEWIYSAGRSAEARPEPSAEERAMELGAAAVRAVEAAPNLPDLQRIFLDEQQVLRNFAPTAGQDVIVPLLDELIKAKDARKAHFVASQSQRPSALVRDLDPAEAARPAKEPEQPDAVAVASGIVNKLQRKADASGLFSELPDDLPWKDDEPPPLGDAR